MTGEAYLAGQFASDVAMFSGMLGANSEAPIGRVLLNCLVHPDHRRKGLATQLYYSALRRASSLGRTWAVGSFPAPW